MHLDYPANHGFLLVWLQGIYQRFGRCNGRFSHFDASGQGLAIYVKFTRNLGNIRLFFWDKTTWQASAMRDSSKLIDLGIVGG